MHAHGQSNVTSAARAGDQNVRKVFPLGRDPIGTDGTSFRHAGGIVPSSENSRGEICLIWNYVRFGRWEGCKRDPGPRREMPHVYDNPSSLFAHARHHVIDRCGGCEIRDKTVDRYRPCGFLGSASFPEYNGNHTLA